MTDAAPARRPRYEVHPGKGGWFYRRRAANGQITEPSESYTGKNGKANAVRAARARANTEGVDVWVLDHNDEVTATYEAELDPASSDPPEAPELPVPGETDPPLPPADPPVVVEPDPEPASSDPSSGPVHDPDPGLGPDETAPLARPSSDAEAREERRRARDVRVGEDALRAAQAAAEDPDQPDAVPYPAPPPA